MKSISLIVATALVCLLLSVAPPPGAAQVAKPVPGAARPAAARPAATTIQPATVTRDPNYVIIGWNDLGMHCIGPRFAEMCILPPANNLRAIVIRRGDDPSVVTTGLTVRYSLNRNTTVQGKTDFWQFAPQLFGANLPLGMGLKGFGLSGTMTAVTDHFEANAVPVLPYKDDGTWNPFQRATLTLTGSGISAVTTIVVPVSDEMNCAKCHATGRIAAPRNPTPTLEGNILKVHDRNEHTTLMASRPVLCASCHSDNALGAAGTPGVSSLSMAMHTKHASIAATPACYDCHPGARTQCNRSAIPAMGAGVNNGPRCGMCHGNLSQMAASLKAGRKPWLEEPTCAQCHGSAFSTGTDLYRNAKGHGGVYCVACHNSPHAWYPSKHGADNEQPLALQNSTKALGYLACNICHTDGRIALMPPHNLDGGD